MRNQVPLIVLFIVIILITVIFLFIKKEGFVGETAAHSKYVDIQAKNYSPLGISLIAARTQGILGNSADKLLKTVGSDTSYPLNDKKTGLFAIIEKCESVKTNDCSAFDDPAFSKDCGVCLDIGKNSQNIASTGGLVLLPDDRIYIKSITKGNGIPDYKPTVGSCPANRLVSSKAECVAMKRKIECEKNATYDLKECGQCYSDQSYTIVDSDPNAGVISGTGTIYLKGNGTLGYTETGYDSKSGITLSSTPYVIQLQGPETTRLSINVTAPSNGTSASLAGYLGGKTATGEFTMDLYRIVLTDTTTGRKPRSVDMTTVNGVDVTIMATGFGKDQMTLVVPTPFTFVDSGTEQATLCKDTPFVTKQASAEFLNSDPCYKKGSGPGKFSLECLQGSYLANGCIDSGKGYPKDESTANKLMTKSNGTYRTLNEIAAIVYTSAVSSSTGVGPDGKKLEVIDWSNASVFCTGKAITSPCDNEAKIKGPLSTDCLAYLWNNGGGNKNAAGIVDQSLATYSITSMASSLFSKNDSPRFCQATGTLSPINASGAVNTGAVKYWKQRGGLDAVKAEMKEYHTMANSQGLSDSQRLEYLRRCYGIDKIAEPIKGPSYPAEPLAAESKVVVKYIRLENGDSRNNLNFSQIVGYDMNGRNITRGRKVTASQSYGYGSNTIPQKAVDGNERIRSHPNQYHSAAELNVFFQVELDSPTRLSYVRIFNREDCCQDRLASYKLILLDANGTKILSRQLSAAPVQTLNINYKISNPVDYEMYGPWMGSAVTVQQIKQLSSGKSLFMLQHDVYTKMVTENGDAMYYVGNINNFDENKMASYASAGKNYIIRRK
jgi:hypothetical protein